MIMDMITDMVTDMIMDKITDMISEMITDKITDMNITRLYTFLFSLNEPLGLLGTLCFSVFECGCNLPKYSYAIATS